MYSVDQSAEMFELLLGLDANPHIGQSGRWSILHQAARQGNLSIFKVLLERNIWEDVNCTSDEGWTPLMVAAGVGKSLEVTSYLVLEHGANVDKRTEQGLTALHEATNNDNPSIVSFLLPHVKEKDAAFDGSTALHSSAYDGHFEITRRLVESGLDINTIDNDHETPLILAIRGKHYDIAIWLIHRKADVNIRNKEGQTAFWITSATDRSDLADELLKADADPRTSTNESGMSCLHKSAWFGNLNMAKLIINARAPNMDVDEKEASTGWTPLLAALNRNHVSVARYLLSVGADVNVVTPSGWTAVHTAAYHITDAELFREIVEKTQHKLLSSTTGEDSTPLHLAADRAFIEAIETLIEKGVDTTLYSKSFCTPLYWAAFSGSAKAVHILLIQKYLPNVQTQWGWTALHASCRKCSGPVVEQMMKVTNWLSRRRATVTPLYVSIKNRNMEATLALLDGGMPISFTSNYGATALHDASDSGNASLIATLKDYGADVDALECRAILPFSFAAKFRDTELLRSLRPTPKGRLWKNRWRLETPIHEAARVALSELQWFEDKGLRTRSRSVHNLTPLHYAVAYGHEDMVEYLLSDPKVQSDVNLPLLFSGWTPMHIAARSCLTDCLELLVRNTEADMVVKDYFGLSPLDYAVRYVPSALAMRAANEELFDVWLQETSPDGYRTQFSIHQTCTLISWKIEHMSDDKKGAFNDCDHDSVSFLLCNALLLLQDEDQLTTALEYGGIGEPETDLDPAFCDYCDKRLKKPFLQGDKVEDPFLTCTVCPLTTFCPDCKERSATENLRGCYEHPFVELPTKSWFTRDRDKVNEEDQTEKDWLGELLEKYEKLKHVDFDTSNLPKLIDDHEEGRISIFKLCTSPDLSQLVDHLQAYPRDIGLKDHTGATVVMKVLDMHASDEKTCQMLETLAAEGAKLLIYNSHKISSVEFACSNGYELSLTFLLEQYDPEFDKVEDPHAAEALQIIIDNQWTQALRFAIERHFDWMTYGKFEWVKQLPSLHMTDDMIVALLSDSASGEQKLQTTSVPYPWVDFQQPQYKDVPTPDKHGDGCVHNMLQAVTVSSGTPTAVPDDVRRKTEEPPATTNEKDQETRPEDEPDYEQDEYESDQPESVTFSSEALEVADTVSRLCGLGGVFPHGPGHAEFFSRGDDTHDVSLAYDGEGGGSKARTTEIRETLLTSGRGLLQAIASVQKVRLCCESFTVLHVLSTPVAADGSPVLGLSGIHIQVVMDFVDAIENSPYNPSRLIGGDDFEGLLDLREPSAIAASILQSCQLHLDAKPWQKTHEVNCCFMAMQVLCVGFLSFLNGHLPDVQLPIISTKLRNYSLLGYAGSNLIEAMPRAMACVGRMLKSEVLAFSVGSLQPVHAKPDEQSRPFYLWARPHDILEIWGPAQCLLERDPNGSPTGRVVGLDIRQGLLTLDAQAKGDVPTAHWSHEETDIEEALAAFSIDETILIGTLHENPYCNFRTRDAWSRADINKLESLHTRDSFWALAGRQITLQLNAASYGSFAVGQNYNYVRGVAKKEAVMNQWNGQIPRVLVESWGVVFSLCTGFSMRVPLREAIAEVLDEYLRDVPLDGPRGRRLPHGWEETKAGLLRMLRGVGTSKREKNDRFMHYWRHIHFEDKPYIAAAITFVLQHLEQTGVDSNARTFRIAWADKRDPYKGLEIPLEHRHVHWLQLLTESRRVATFAVATPRCLVAHLGRGLFGARSSCRGAEDERDPSQMVVQLLQTKVLPTEASEANWALHSKKNYLFRPTGTTKIISLLEGDANSDHYKKYLVVFDLGNVGNRVIDFVARVLNEQEVLQENHTNYRNHMLERVTICTLKQWLEEQNRWRA